MPEPARFTAEELDRFLEQILDLNTRVDIIVSGLSISSTYRNFTATELKEELIEIPTEIELS